jgi:hypothetical protein
MTTTWRLWECERGNRWSSVIDYGDAKMNKGLDGVDHAKEPCGFSGCTPDHGVRAVKDTQDRSEAHDWFNRNDPNEGYISLVPQFSENSDEDD